MLVPLARQRKGDLQDDDQNSGPVQLGHLRTVDQSRAVVNSTVKVPDQLEQDVDTDRCADFTKEYRPQHERLTLPTTFNTK